MDSSQFASGAVSTVPPTVHVGRDDGSTASHDVMKVLPTFCWLRRTEAGNGCFLIDDVLPGIRPISECFVLLALIELMRRVAWPYFGD